MTTIMSPTDESPPGQNNIQIQLHIPGHQSGTCSVDVDNYLDKQKNRMQNKKLDVFWQNSKKAVCCR